MAPLLLFESREQLGTMEVTQCASGMRNITAEETALDPIYGSNEHTEGHDAYQAKFEALSALYKATYEVRWLETSRSQTKWENHKQMH